MFDYNTWHVVQYQHTHLFVKGADLRAIAACTSSNKNIGTDSPLH